MFLSAPRLIPVPIAHIDSLFKNDPAFMPLDVPDLWSSDAPLIYQSRATGCVVTVPKGLISDFASTPKALQWLPFMDDDGMSRLAGFTHDACYKIGRQRGKEFADELLREMLIDSGFSNLTAGLYYQGVHLFGAKAWAGDGKNANWGVATRSNFLLESDYDAFNAAGRNIYSS